MPERDTFFAGFVRSDTDSNIATPQARTISVDRVNNIVDTAAEGEIRFTFRDALTRDEDTALNDAITAHDATGKTSEQDRIDQDAADLETMLTNYPNITTMTDAEFRDHVEMLTRNYLREFRKPTPAI